MPERKPLNNNTSRLGPHASLSGASETRQLLGALVDLASELNSSLDLSNLLRTVMEKAREVMEAEACSLLFLERETGGLVYEVALSPVGELLREKHFLPRGKGIAGHVVQTGEPYFTNNPYDDANFCEEADRHTGFQTRNILCVPLKTREEGLIGVAQVLNRKDEKTFGEDDMFLFQAFADMASVSIANARLHEESIARRKLEQEMNVARQIQESLLPTKFPSLPGLLIEAITIPAFHVGGDFYDAFTLRDGRACVVVGDVSGKGPSASLYAACLHSELHLALEFLTEPRAALERLNDTMYSRSRNGAFATLLMLVIARDGSCVTVVNAGHPPPLLFAAGNVSQVESEPVLPLGALPKQVYGSVEISLPDGGALLVYSDGVTEAKNRAGDDFGLARLRECFAALAPQGASIIPGVRAGVSQFTEGAACYDDITLAALSRKPA
jgi:sigma-B regulation protein RsbU (phosphoserine phosphatase)